VSDVDRRISDYRSTAHLEEVDARLEDGTTVPLMFKASVRPSTMDEEEPVRPSFMSDPAREPAVYREILGPSGVSSPELFAADCDPSGHWSWLLMERVRGRQLWQCGEDEIWCDAAAWLARHHAAHGEHGARPPAAARLPTIDAEHHMRWFDRARAMSDPDTVRARAMGTLARHYPRVLALLDATPVSFLHGEFFPSNVLVRDERDRETRICPVDWETAAVGPSLLDLAALTAGDWHPATRARVESAYYRAAAEVDPCLPDERTFGLCLTAARIQLAVTQVGWSMHWSPPPEHRHDWLGDIVGLLPELET